MPSRRLSSTLLGAATARCGDGAHPGLGAVDAGLVSHTTDAGRAAPELFAHRPLLPQKLKPEWAKAATAVKAYDPSIVIAMVCWHGALCLGLGVRLALERPGASVAWGPLLLPCRRAPL
jgi:hypothetical protein